MMAIPFTQRVRPPVDVLMRELDDEAVLLHLGREIYYGLDDIGTRMWTVLVSADSIQVAYDILLGEFDVEPEVLRRDLEAYLAQLIDHDLLRSEGHESA